MLQNRQEFTCGDFNYDEDVDMVCCLSKSILSQVSCSPEQHKRQAHHPLLVLALNLDAQISMTSTATCDENCNICTPKRGNEHPSRQDLWGRNINHFKKQETWGRKKVRNRDNFNFF